MVFEHRDLLASGCAGVRRTCEIVVRYTGSRVKRIRGAANMNGESRGAAEK